MAKQVRETALKTYAALTQKPPARWTAAVYLEASPPDDGILCEVLDGELIMAAAPILWHQEIILNVAEILRKVVRAKRLGKVFPAPVDVVLGDDLVEPDVIFVSNDRQDIMKRERIVGAPDLVVEVLSLSTSQRDLRYKWDLYARHGVREYWIVNPEMETVEVLTLVDGSYQRLGLAKKDEPLASKVLETLNATVADVFAE